MKELKDYLHLYKECDCRVYEEDMIDFTIDKMQGCYLNKVVFKEYGVPIRLVKPILRPLSDMTEDEKNNLSWEWKVDYDFKPIFRPDQFLFLLSKHFDLFGLIDAGLAIDKTTLK